MLECLSCSWIVIVVVDNDDEGLLLLLLLLSSMLLSVAERQSLMIFSCSLESVLVVVMVSGYAVRLNAIGVVSDVLAS